MTTPSSIAALVARAGALSPSLPTPNALSDDALELFYAQELVTMVRETLRPSLSRARAGARVPMHKVAMALQMGRPADDSQEKALARAFDRSGRVRWEALLHGSTAAVRQPYWNDAMHMLTEVRNDLYTAQHGPASPNVRPIISLVDAWHNLPILMVQRGVRSIDPKRVGLEGRVALALTRREHEAVAAETQALRDAVDAVVDPATNDTPTRRRTL